MTWDEFDKFVRREMEKKGISPETKLWFVDVTYPGGTEIRVFSDEDGNGLAVTD